MPHVPAFESTPELNAAFAQAQAHFLERVVPLWEGPGWNPELGLPYEALDGQLQPLPPKRYRAMACARQLYLFSSLIERPGAQARAAQLFDALNRYFADPHEGGWYYSVDPQGAPLDREKDLYTHAFIVFACAHYWAKRPAPAVAATLDRALAVVAERFSTGDGLYEAKLGEAWQCLGSGPLQNPLMHLAEAFLATLQARADAATQQALLALCAQMQVRFIDPADGFLLEKPYGTVDNWFEPGHQFEWFYLLQSSDLLRSIPLSTTLAASFALAEQAGVREGAVMAALSPDGQLTDATQRIWAQAEYLRALTLRPDGATKLVRQLEALNRRFLHANGWHECRDGQGAVSRHDMPSTTPYHLATCYQGLAIALG